MGRPQVVLPVEVSAKKKQKTASVVLRTSLLLLAGILPVCAGALYWGTVSPVRWSSSVLEWSFRPAGRTKPLPCQQADAILPTSHNVSTIWDHKDRVIAWHQGIIRIPTEVQDEMGEPGEDRRWDVFGDLHAWLEEAYPLIHKHLRKTTVDTYGLVYEWAGSDSSLKPIFLAAHQDVVPVLPETLDQWIEDPYGGKYDGKYIWGRGSNDDKSGVTSIMAAIELLLELSDFTPTRTVILGFGHDEEAGGRRGAPAIRDWMLEHYGPDSVSLLVDEGSGIVNAWGATFGTAGTAEKGRIAVDMTVTTLGGHSSIPPSHTNIGLTALLIAELERHPYHAVLEKQSPVWEYLRCGARYGPDMPGQLRSRVVKSEKSQADFHKLPSDVVKFGLENGTTSPGMGNKALALISTTQAIDVIRGGMKVNALPEKVSVLIDHRIDVGSSVSEVIDHLFETLNPVAREFGLSLSGFNRSLGVEAASTGSIHLSEALNSWLEPAPISPATIESPAWRVFAGTSRGVYATKPPFHEYETDHTDRRADLAEDELIMSPLMASGNTDTRRYHRLTKNIYRWKHLIDIPGSHTINERVVADGLMEYTRFYQALILNADAARDL